MSLVYITHHTENVYDYENMRVGYVTEEKKPRAPYVSMHKKRIKKQSHRPYITDAPGGIKLIDDNGIHEHRSMGCACTPLNPPKLFLRKNEGLKWRRTHDHICPKPNPLAPVPHLSQLEMHKKCEPEKKPSKDKSESASLAPSKTSTSQKGGHCKTKNFIRINRKRAIESKCRNPPAQIVDTPNGDRHNLLNSGLIPQFVCKKNFAKVPCYLKAHKALLKKYKDICKEESDLSPENVCDRFIKKQGVRQMSVDERVSILEGLKYNYREILRTFQTLSLYTDTPTKKLRKARLEKELIQLETDIQFIYDNPVIFLSDK